MFNNSNKKTLIYRSKQSKPPHLSIYGLKHTWVGLLFLMQHGFLLP